MSATVDPQKAMRLNHAAAATKAAVEAHLERDRTILAALESCSLREVAAATGLSFSRIHQIHHGR